MCDCVCIWFSQEDHVKNREFGLGGRVKEL